jgi:hypothetical protein
MEKPFADMHLTLQKYPGKGGWTYVELPGLKSRSIMPFGWVIVSGSVDGYPLSNYKLWPMKNGNLFMPVKAAIRKKIAKEEGDTVHVVLRLDDGAPELPDDVLSGLQDEATAYRRFREQDPAAQREQLEWIAGAGNSKERGKRITSIISRVLKNENIDTE